MMLSVRYMRNTEDNTYKDVGILPTSFFIAVLKNNYGHDKGLSIAFFRFKIL